MGVAFEVARVGTRYKPNLLPIHDKPHHHIHPPSPIHHSLPTTLKVGAEFADDSNKKHNNVLHSTSEELEVSFSLNLFRDGFSIGKGNKFPSDVPKQLLPYDKASETLFSAIEYGWLPGDMLDDIPCKYVNGALMCEIRDYRHIFSYKEGHTLSTASIPIVHYLTLQLCMETVVKDILSVTNNSWTYENLLEIESCIIKALQPDLHLNPEPLGSTPFGEPRRKKLDLGIAWSWRKRKLSDEPVQVLPIRDSNLVTHARHDCLTQKYKVQRGPLEKEKSTSRIQENIPSSYCSPLEINSALGYSSASYALMVSKTPNFVGMHNQSLANANNGMPRGNSIVSCENSTHEKQYIKGIPYKKPKQEPVDLPKLQLVGSQVSIAPQGPELLGVDNGLPEQFKADKILCETKKRKFQFPQSTYDDQVMPKGIQNHQIRAPSVKQEPAEISGLHTEGFGMDSGIGQANLYNTKQAFSSKPLTVNDAPIRSSNHMDQPYDKRLKNGNAAPKRKKSQNLQATAADGILSTTQNSDSMQRKSTMMAAHKDCRSRGLKAEMADAVIGMSSRNLAGANSLTVRNLCTPQQSVEVNNAADRLVKILKLCERYKLINRKLKQDRIVPKKPSFRLTPLVGVHLASFEDSGPSEDSMRYKISSSKHSIHWKTRTLKFSREYPIIQRTDHPAVDDAALVKLVLLENLGLGTVEAHICYGHDGDHSAPLSLLPAFSGSLRSVNQFACQFTSLMIREGYRITSDQVGYVPCNENGELGIKKQPIVSNSILPYGNVKPPATCTAGSSSPPVQNSNGKMPFQHDVAMQFPQPNILPGVNVAAGGNSLPSPQQALTNSFDLQIDNLQQQMRSIQQYWQHSANRFLWLQYQMQLLKHWQEQELIPRTESTVHLGAAASGHDTVPLNGGQRIIRNTESSFYSHITGINGSGPIFSEGLMPWPISLRTSSNPLNNHISGLNYEQLFYALSDGRFSAPPQPNASQGQGFFGVLPASTNASMLSIANADATNIRNIFNNHREPWAETSQRLHTVQKQDISRSMAMLGPKMAPSLADQVFSSLPLAPSLPNSLPQSSTQRLNPISMPASQQMNHGSKSGSGSPEVSAWTHGSVGSSNI